VLGTATFCSLGIALSSVTTTPDSASTIAPFTVVMLAFFSGIWTPVDQLPTWLETVDKIFPLYHVALGLQTTLSPNTKGSGLDAQNILILAIWAIAGARIASRRFRWEPQTVRA
jgi:ABC-2 type transport system permease protein